MLSVSLNKTFPSFVLVVISGPLQESAVWIDESQTVRTLRDGQASAQLHDREDEDPLGISSEGDKLVCLLQSIETNTV